MSRKRRNRLFAVRRTNRAWADTQHTAVLGSNIVIGIIAIVFMAVLTLHFQTGVNSIQAEIQSEENRGIALDEKLQRENTNWVRVRASIKETLAKHAIRMDRARPYQIVAMSMPQPAGAGTAARQTYAKTR